ncbi:hypothetical protein HK405_013393, partial [Cladochytrium tenue]
MVDEMVAEKVLAKEVEMKQLMDEKVRFYKETEYSLQRQLNLVKDELVGLKSANDHAEIAVKLGELEIVSGDLERTTTKLSHLERENELLKKDLANLRGDGSSVVRGEWQDPVALLRRIKAQDAEINNLLKEIEKGRAALGERETVLTRRINELERESAVRRLEVEQLREKLLQFEDYDQIKHELEVMKRVEFANPGEEALPLEEVQEFSTKDSYMDYSLEKLLMDKNKRLQGEVTLSERENTLEATASELASTRARADAQARLVHKLEEDVYQLNSMVAKPQGVVPPTAAAA